MTTSLALLLMAPPFPDDAPLLHGPDSALTVGEAKAAGRAIAARLHRVGLQPGQAVAVQMRDGP